MKRYLIYDLETNTYMTEGRGRTYFPEDAYSFEIGCPGISTLQEMFGRNGSWVAYEHDTFWMKYLMKQ